MKKWWPFIMKTLAFALLFAMADYCMGPLFVNAKDKALERHPDDIWLKSSYSVEKVDAECVIIGSSTAVHHYDPEIIESKTGLSAYNCGQDGCFLKHSCCIINSILERYSPKMIIMDISPRALLDSDKRDEYQNMRFLSYYYDNNPVVKNFIDSKGKRNEWLYHANFFRYNSHAIYTFYPVFWGTSTKQGYVPLPPKTHALDKAINHVEWEGDWVDSYLALLFNTIDNCKKHGVEFVVVSSPYYADFGDSVMKKCDEFAEMLGNKGVKFINFLNKAPYAGDYSLFKDNSHVNSKGAEMMTDTLVKMLRPCI